VTENLTIVVYDFNDKESDKKDSPEQQIPVPPDQELPAPVKEPPDPENEPAPIDEENERPKMIV
jgi:hypothetical protein